MELSTKTYRRIWLISAVLYFLFGYLFLNWLNSDRVHYFNVGFPFESQIPFIPFFVFGYTLVYISVFGVYLLMPDNVYFKKVAKMFFVLTTVHFAFFILMPVKMTLRPILSQGTGIINEIVKFYYWIDNPYNCFPSLHVAYTLLGGLVLWNYKRKWACVYMLTTLIVSISVILVKQHYILDVVGGYVTAILIYLVMSRRTAQ